MDATVSPQEAACMAQAAHEYTLPLRGLCGVRLTEGGKIGTVSPNRNGTHDYGPFQINTTWLKRLQRDYGITPAAVTSDFCLSARSAAYILRYEINLAGGSFWDGVGHYHSRTPALKAKYVARVYRNSTRC